MIKAAVLGGNVGASRSPVIHEAAYRALRKPGHYTAISVDARRFRALVRHLADEGYDYVNVTIPHKKAAAAMAARSSRLVKLVGAANTLVIHRRGGKVTLEAENTDGHGLIRALGDLGVTVTNKTIIVLVGSGGAAAGGLAALLAEGARVRLVARRTAPARALKKRFGPRAGARIDVIRWTPETLKQALFGATALISAVPAAAWDAKEARAGLAGLSRDTAVLEMAYGGTTPLCLGVRERVARYQDGLPMLVHQAARAVELVVGQLPPAAPLLRAARGRRQSSQRSSSGLAGKPGVRIPGSSK